VKRSVFIAVFAFAAGVIVRDQAQDYTPLGYACMQERQRASQFAAAIAHVLNGGSIETNDVRASCRITPTRKES
jgi:hypothetical protein